MCGIGLYINRNKQSFENDIQKIFNAFMCLKPRGPDKTTFEIFDNHSTAIGFHRLALNGLTKHSANQPFVFDSDDKISYIICNGEIYNYKELSQKYDITLSSGSDCEILYPLFEKIGIQNMLNVIRGEFSFIIYQIFKNTNDIKITVARDHCGIRPLFIYNTKTQLYLASELKGIPYNTKESTLEKSKKNLLLKTKPQCLEYPPQNLLIDNYLDNSPKQFPPRCYIELSLNNNQDFIPHIIYKEFIDFTKITQKIFNRDAALNVIQNELIKSVESRMMCDRDFCCLLSGGLDSSLVSAIAQRYLSTKGKKLKTFCIGIDENSPDTHFANIVAKHIGSEHQTIIIPEITWIEAINNVIYSIESYDITSVRASTGQFLISLWISLFTDYKALLIGDGSDELTGGYLYMLNAPDSTNFNNEILELINNIHLFDVLRSDRGVSSNGLEARVPFLERDFIEKYLSISIDLRIPSNGVEKHLLRDAFKNTGLLPDNVLYRKKEAFSDGVSTTKRSWYQIIQENANQKYTDAEFNEKIKKYTHNIPPTKEALLYREIFEEHFGQKESIAKVIPKFWLPKWSGNITEPSARILNIYNQRD